MKNKELDGLIPNIRLRKGRLIRVLPLTQSLSMDVRRVSCFFYSWWVHILMTLTILSSSITW